MARYRDFILVFISVLVTFSDGQDPNDIGLNSETFRARVTYETAQAFCESRNRTLFEVRTEAQRMHAIQQARLYGNDVWLGGNDRKKEGRFVWQSQNDIVDLPEFWWRYGAPGEEKPKKQDCLVMEQCATVDDIKCNKKRGFICASPHIL